MKVTIDHTTDKHELMLDKEAMELSEDDLASFLTDAIADLQNLVLSLSANNDHD